MTGLAYIQALLPGSASKIQYFSSCSTCMQSMIRCRCKLYQSVYCRMLLADLGFLASSPQKVFYMFHSIQYRIFECGVASSQL